MTILGLLALTAFGGFIRVAHIGRADTKADEVWLVHSLQGGMDTWSMLIFNLKDFKAGRHMPIPRTATAAFVRSFGLNVSLTSIRLPFAIVGILVVPALWLLGSSIYDRNLGWMMAFLGMINPYSIFYSRSAHVYSFVVCFVAWSFACFVIAVVKIFKAGDAGWKQMLPVCLFSITACYSHMSTWPAIGLFWLLLFASYYAKNRKLSNMVHSRPIWMSFAIWVLALLPWALVFLYGVFTNTTSSFWSSLPTTRMDEFKELWRMPFVMTWGGGPVRGTVTVGTLLLGVVGCIFDRRWRKWILALLIGGLILFAMLAATMFSTGFFAIRYFSPMWMFFFPISTTGLFILARILSKWVFLGKHGMSYSMCGLCACMGILMYSPIRWIVTLPGMPAPYSRINQWMDTNLPKGAPILVDRWFEPWNEMLYHAPSNVHITFTIPDEPIDVYVKYEWRETAKHFFRRFPDAAYLELTRHYFEFPQVGFWQWPRDFFKHHITFTNEQALALRNSILAPHEDYYASTTNRIVVDLFYNRPEDVVQIARERGDKVLRLYGSGWGYTKLWRQMQGDFRDWRVLEREAFIDIHNLTDEPLDVQVEIVAAAAPGNKQVQSSSGSAFRFEGQKIMKWQFLVNDVPPGRRQIILRDPLWPSSQSALLVGELEISAADDASVEKKDP